MNTLSVEYTNIDTEYIILENIRSSEEQQIPLRQRDLAQIAGASLGMTNAILKRLVQKGWITAKKLNSRNIQYAVTIDGMNEIVRRSYRYFKRTIKNVVYFKEILEETIHRAGRRNINSVVLIGTSDLDFILEHICRRWGLNFTKIAEGEEAGQTLLPNTLKIYAEGIPELLSVSPIVNNSPENQGLVQHTQPNTFYLSRLLLKQAVRATV